MNTTEERGHNGAEKRERCAARVVRRIRLFAPPSGLPGGIARWEARPVEEREIRPKVRKRSGGGERVERRSQCRPALLGGKNKVASPIGKRTTSRLPECLLPNFPGRPAGRFGRAEGAPYNVTEAFVQGVSRIRLAQPRAVHDAAHFVVDKRDARNTPRSAAAQTEVYMALSEPPAQRLFRLRIRKDFLHPAPGELLQSARFHLIIGHSIDILFGIRQAGMAIIGEGIRVFVGLYTLPPCPFRNITRVAGRSLSILRIIIAQMRIEEKSVAKSFVFYLKRYEFFRN